MNKLTVCKDNRVIEAGYRLSRIEQNIILYAISKVNPYDDSLENLNIEINVKEFSDIFNLNEKSIYNQLKIAINNLYERSIKVKDPINEEEFRWISGKKYFNQEGRLTLSFTQQIAPYLTKIKENFKHYKLINVSKFRKEYSFRFYEFFVQFVIVGYREILINDLKEMLMIEESYRETKELTRKVVKPCVDEINKFSNLKVTYKTIKKGVKITGYRFEIKSDNAQEIEQQIEESTQKEINKIIKNKVAENIEKEKTNNTENLNLYLSIIKALEQSEQKLITLTAKEINLLIKFEKSFHKNNRRFIFKSEEQKNYLMGVLSKKGTLKNHIQDNKTQEENEKKKQAKEEKLNSIELKSGMILVGSATQNEYVINEFCAIVGAQYKNSNQDFLSVGVNPIQLLKELVACDKLKIK